MTGLSNEEMAIRETQFDIELTEMIKRIFPELTGEEIDADLLAKLTGSICGTLGAIIGGSIGVLAYSAPSREAKIAGLSHLLRSVTDAISEDACEMAEVSQSDIYDYVAAKLRTKN